MSVRLRVPLMLPDDECGDAAAFTQDGHFIRAGHFEECEQVAMDHAGLYCWIVNGQPVIRGNFIYDPEEY